MNLESFYEYCISKRGVTEHFPFDDNTLVFKVGDKMFVLSSLKHWELGEPSMNLKCNPERALELRAEYDAVEPGFHMSKVHWNTIAVNSDVNDAFLKELIDHSYDLIFNSLTKKVQAEILALD